MLLEIQNSESITLIKKIKLLESKRLIKQINFGLIIKIQSICLFSRKIINLLEQA